MIGRIVIVLSAMLLVWGLSACGTIEVGLEDEGEEALAQVGSDEGTTVSTAEASPTATATERPEVAPSATASPAAETPEASATPSAVVQVAPADWQRFYDETYGLTLWHPPGTTAVIGEPAQPVFSSLEFPEGIVEEQVFVVRVIQEEGGPFGPGGPQVILEVKLVANPEQASVAVMAERFGQRCPGSPPDSLQPTTVTVGLSGFRYGCEGIDGIIFNEFWGPHPTDPLLLVGAVWADMSAPLADNILATVTFTG